MKPKSSENTTNRVISPWHELRHQIEIPLNEFQIEALSKTISDSLEKLEKEFEEFVTPQGYKKSMGRR